MSKPQNCQGPAASQTREREMPGPKTTIEDGMKILADLPITMGDYPSYVVISPIPREI